MLYVICYVNMLYIINYIMLYIYIIINISYSN